MGYIPENYLSEFASVCQILNESVFFAEAWKMLLDSLREANIASELSLVYDSILAVVNSY